MPLGVQLAQIERIFEILDRLHISREAVVIPLRPQGRGNLSLLDDGKLEIVVPEEVPFDDWYTGLEPAIQKLMAG